MLKTARGQGARRAPHPPHLQLCLELYRLLLARCHVVPSAASPLQGRDFAAALQRSGLGLGPIDVAGLVAGVQDGQGAVDYRTVASKLWGKLQLGQAAAAGGSSGGKLPSVAVKLLRNGITLQRPPDHLLQPLLVARRRLLGLLVGGRPLRFWLLLRLVRAVMHLGSSWHGHRKAGPAGTSYGEHGRFAAAALQSAVGLQ